MTSPTLEMDRLADAFSCQNTSCNNYSTLQGRIHSDDAKTELGGAQAFLPEGISLAEKTRVPYGCRECPVAYLGEVASQPGVEDIATRNGTTTFRYNGHQYELGPGGVKPSGSPNGWVKIEMKTQKGRIDIKESVDSCLL